MLIACASTTVANAQYIDSYIAVSGGITSIDGNTSPAATFRVGAETDIMLFELEYAHLTSELFSDNDGVESRAVGTVGFNVGAKLLSSYAGYLAVAGYLGYEIRDSFCYTEYYGHGYYETYSYTEYGKFYIGAGLMGSVNLSNYISLFAEARYQSIPFKGRNSEWGTVASLGPLPANRS